MIAAMIAPIRTRMLAAFEIRNRAASSAAAASSAQQSTSVSHRRRGRDRVQFWLNALRLLEARSYQTGLASSACVNAATARFLSPSNSAATPASLRRAAQS